MGGNASFRHHNTSVLSVGAVEAPTIMSSAAFDERLKHTYERVGLQPGMLEKLAGVKERRWWPADVSFADAAAMAGAKALAEAGIDPAQIGVMINTSVCREHLEPSTAVVVHHQLGLPTNCLNFDLANACLGFVNGIQLAGTMIDSGQADYALLVDAEGLRADSGGDTATAGRRRRHRRRRPLAIRHVDPRFRFSGDGPRADRSCTPRATGSSAASAGPAPNITTSASAT